MKKPIVIIGVGEIGGVFARGLLRLGHPIYPITRDMDIQKAVSEIPDPECVLLTVAEADLPNSLKNIPQAWVNKLVLVQNELLPKDWKTHNIESPTVISIWFEKKKGQDAKVVLPSPAFGTHAQLLIDALACIDIPAHSLSSPEELEFELVRKNVYILTTNISGLVCGGVVGDLWENNQTLATEIANEVMDLQETLIDKKIDRARQIDGFVEGIQGDLQHKCMGRSAPARLARAITLADDTGLKVPKLREIAAIQEDK